MQSCHLVISCTLWVHFQKWSDCCVLSRNVHHHMISSSHDFIITWFHHHMISSSHDFIITWYLPNKFWWLRYNAGDPEDILSSCSAPARQFVKQLLGGQFPTSKTSKNDPRKHSYMKVRHLTITCHINYISMYVFSLSLSAWWSLLSYFYIVELIYFFTIPEIFLLFCT